MASEKFIKDVIDYVKDNQYKLEFNKVMFEISEGDLLKYVKTSLNQQLNEESAKIAGERAAPINFWNKIIRKLSTLYAKPVKRTTINPSDQELIEYYEKQGIDKHFGNLNENYNSYKWSSLELFEDEEMRMLRTRAVPSHQFIAYSDDKVDPLRPTAIIKLMGDYVDEDNITRQRLWIYTQYEFIPILDNGKVVIEDLAGNEGLNPYGIIPFQYASMSQYLLVPIPDADTKQMTILIPVLFTDQNYGSMFLSFPIIYTSDMDAENMPAAPNHFVNLKSDSPDKAGTIGVVKAEPDLEAQMNHALRQLDAWLDSRDINAQGLGSLSAENFASGVSKVISEMDTIENRKNQEIIFKEVEVKFWKRLAEMHNILAAAGRLENRQQFSDPKSLYVSVEYSEETIFETRMDRIARLKIEVEAGLNSQKRAIKELNPSMEEEQVDELIEEINESRISVIEVNEDEDESNGLQTI